MSDVMGIGRAIGSVVERVGPSVVGIGERWRDGCGVVIARDRVVTNAHNVRGEGAPVTFAGGRTSPARALGVDADGDLAVLEVPTGDAPALAPGPFDPPTIGTPVIALARASDGGIRATLGFVSSVDQAFRGPRGRLVSGAIEHTAPLAAGSSGGPLVDLDGRLVGIDTNRLDNGFYLALPADATLGDRLGALGRGETPRRRHLGVGLAPAHAARRMRRAVGLPEREGALVRFVEEGSPAAAAGIEVGDLIVAIDGRPVTGADDLLEALAGEGALSLTVVRGNDERTVPVTA